MRWAVEANPEPLVSPYPRPCYVPQLDLIRHTYTWRGTIYPSVTQVLRFANVMPVPPVDPATLVLAGQRGTLIHQATAKVDMGLSHDVVQKGLHGYMDAYAAFRESQAFRPLHDWTEQALCDPQLEIAGTPDRVGLSGDNIGTVVDLKTPNAHEPGYEVQLAAYRHLLRVNGFKAPRRIAVYLRANGTFRLRECDDPGDDAAFLAALTIYRWKLRHTAKGKMLA